MILKKLEINKYDYGRYWEEKMNKELKDATYVFMTEAPYNEGRTLILYAYYPDKPKATKFKPIECGSFWWYR